MDSCACLLTLPCLSGHTTKATRWVQGVMARCIVLDRLDDYVRTRQEKYALVDKISISIFDFPSDALPREREVEEENASINPQDFVVDTVSEKSSSYAKGLTCKTCCKTFSCREQQVEHFKSKLHPINLKRLLLKLPPLINESDLETYEENEIVYKEQEDAEEEENEYEQEEEEDMADEEIEVDTYAAQRFEDHESVNNLPLQTSLGSVSKLFSPTLGPTFIYHPRDSKWQVGVSIACIQSVEQDNDESRILQNNDPWETLHFTLYKAVSNTLWCVMLLRSGKFAITIFEKDTPVLHKVKKHYTVRAKAGGSQSNHDNKGSNAKSMGANLRRRGEAKLREDIKDILIEWRSQIQSCGLLLTSIPKTMKSHVFWDEDGKDTYLYRTDSRLRSIPFITDKPSFEETKRVHSICSTISLTRHSGDISIVEDASNSSQPINSSFSTNNSVVGIKKSSSSSSSTTQFDILPETAALCEACNEGDSDKVLTMLGKFKVDNMLSCINFPHNVEDLSTALHVASENGNSEIVKLLLINGADPTRVDCRSRTPYTVAKDKDTRDTFRRCRGYDGMEEMWNWDSCGVPAAITEEIEKAQKEREKEKKRRAKQKKKETKEKNEREALEAKQREEQDRILAEQRKLEKIKDAGECAACKISLYGKKVFDVFDRRCCSGPCMIKYRRQLSAEAAEKRLNGGKS